MSPTRKRGSAQLLGLEILLAVALLVPTGASAAQSGGQVLLLQPDTSHFPTVTLNFETYDAQGNFITTLDSSKVQALEDGKARSQGDLSLEQPGLQLSLALNTGPTLAYTFNNVSRFDQVRKLLYEWAKAQPANGVDDYSLVAAGGSLGTHLADPQQFAQALTGYAPDLMKNQPSLASLIQSLDLATDPLKRPFMKRAILYVTPLLPDTTLQALPNLADRANQLGIHIFVWLVLPSPVGDTNMTRALRSLATTTGGQFFTFSGTEPFPDINAYFQPLRFHYQLTYTSAISQSGAHTLSVSIQQDGETLSSNKQTVTLALQPPNPMFLSPPAQVQRSWTTRPAAASEQDGSSASGQSVLTPASVRLNILVEFPDGFPRQLKAARLYVDGKLASELTAAPFGSFDWALAGIDRSSRHLMRVEVEDQLGLVRSSIEMPVDVVVAAAPPPAGVSIFGIGLGQALQDAGAILVIAALVLGGAWSFRRLQARRKARPKRAPGPARPHLQMPSPVQAVPRNRRVRQGSAPARLMRLTESGHVQPGSAVPLDLAEITIGRDPKRAAYVLESSSVNALHARLCQAPDGKFVIYDAGSVAGTWVNYAQVGEEGAGLHHGDLIQIGRETFRFELNHPAPAHVPQVTSLNELQPSFEKSESPARGNKRRRSGSSKDRVP